MNPTETRRHPLLCLLLIAPLWWASAQGAPAPKTSQKPAADALLRREAVLMGTQFRVTAAGVSAKRLDLAVHAAFSEVARIEALMSEWRPDSEISAVNQAAGQQPVAVSPETFTVVKAALDLAEMSEGAFDPTWAALKGLWDFQADPPQVPAPEIIKARLKKVGWRKVKLDAEAKTIFLTEPGMALGLGGIAKGYGIDQAAKVLKSHGIERFIVDGGGDLYVSGVKPSGAPWKLGVQGPRSAGKLIATLAVTDAAMVTSGDYERFFVIQGKRYHHIIDLRTGYPAALSRAVTVRAKEAIFADALSTAIFVLGPHDGLALAERLPGVEAAVVGADGKIVATKALAPAFGLSPR